MLRSPFPLGDTQRGGLHKFSLSLIGWIAGLCSLLFVSQVLAEVPDRDYFETVRQLGSSRFAEREAASIELIEAGVKALPALKQGMELADPEVRTRAQVVHHQIEETWFAERAELFVSGKNEGEDFPGWKEAKVLLGDSTYTRQLFVRLSRRFPDFVAALSGSPQDKSRAAETVADLSRKRQFQNIAPEVEDILALLLVANDKQVTLPTNVHRRIAELTSQSFFNEAVTDKQASDPLNRLTSQWILVSPDSNAIDALYLGVTRNEYLAAGAERARRMLDLENLNAEDFTYVIFVLTRKGDRKDAKRMQRFFQDRRELYRGVETIVNRNPNPVPNPDNPFRPGNEVQLRITQVRDVALAAAFMLHRVSPREAGFPNAAVQNRWFIDPGSVDAYGFTGPDDEVRAKVFAEFEKRFAGSP